VTVTVTVTVTLRSRCVVVSRSAGSEHAPERGAELRAHSAVDEEVSGVGEQDDEVDEDTGLTCRSRHQQIDAERVLDYNIIIIIISSL